MKKNSGKKLIQFVLLATIIAIVGYSIVDNLYGPFPTGKGFPLNSVWETKVNDNIRQVIVSENGYILVRLGYSVNSLSLKTGDLIWKYRTDDPIYTIAIYKGIIYVIGKNTLYTLDEKTGSLIWQQVIYDSLSKPEIIYIDNNSLVTTVVGGVLIFNSQTGKINAHIAYGNGTIDACVYKDKLYIFHYIVEAYELENGEFLWGDKSSNYTDAACVDNMAYLVINRSEIVSYDLVNKSQVWSHPFPPADPHAVDNIYSTQGVLIADGLNNLFVISKESGNVLQEIPEHQHITSTAIIGNNLFTFDIFAQAIYSYDINTWENTGRLQYALPTIGATELDRFSGLDNQLILWKGKRLFLYE